MVTKQDHDLENIQRSSTKTRKEIALSPRVVLNTWTIENFLSYFSVHLFTKLINPLFNTKHAENTQSQAI